MSYFARCRAWLARRRKTTPERALTSPPGRHPSILLVVEGSHDIELFKRMSTILSAADPELPDLAAMERRGELLFVPFGGGDLWLWVDRLAPLALPEFHLYDKEQPPETERRRRVADAVNRRPGCRAVITAKRALENYLHPAAIREVCGIELEIGDDDPVADLLARRLYGREDEVPWQELPRRTQTRRRNRVKKRLHTKAVDRMTPGRLAERDPEKEVISWLQAIGGLAGSAR